MSPQEKEERLAAIAARLKAVGPVEWRSMRDGNQYLYGIEGKQYLPTVNAVRASRVDGLARAWNPHAVIAFMQLDAAHVSRFEDDEADLIANAPADLAWLLSELTALHEEVRAQFAAEGWEIASVKDAAAEMDRLSGMVRIEARNASPLNGCTHGTVGWNAAKCATSTKRKHASCPSTRPVLTRGRPMRENLTDVSIRFNAGKVFKLLLIFGCWSAFGALLVDGQWMAMYALFCGALFSAMLNCEEHHL